MIPIAEVAQFLVSLTAIFILAGLAKWWKLGVTAKTDVRKQLELSIAETAQNFIVQKLHYDEGSKGALALDTKGRVLLLKAHGSKFAGRVLGPQSSVRNHKGCLSVNSGEKMFGTITFKMSDKKLEYWANAINKL